jgi:Mrp family chromosome partitioning ATPase
MGRILDALRQAEASRRRPVEASPRPAPPEWEIAPVDDTAETVPFVEVGGPRSNTAPLDASLAGTDPFDNCKHAAAAEHRSPLLAPSANEPTPLPIAFEPVATEVPGLAPAGKRFNAALVAFHDPAHPVSEQYRALAAGISAQLPGGRAHVLLGTSHRPAVGTTNVLLNLAVTLAREGFGRVVVIDANLRKPALAARFGLPGVPGLQDVLAGYATLPRALQETGQQDLHVLTAGEETAEGPVRMAGDALRSVLRLLAQRFDWILLDGPAWDGRPEVVALGLVADACYLVVPQADAASAEVAQLLKIIPEQGSPLRGCILVQAAELAAA